MRIDNHGGTGLRRQAALGAALVLLGVVAGDRIDAQGRSLDPASGEQRLDGHLVRWNTTTLGYLPRQAIETHGLQSGGRGVLNVVVLRDADGETPPQTVTADIAARVRNLRGQVQHLDIRLIEANGRVSYLGTFEVGDRDQLQFELDIQPSGQIPLTIRFERRFFGE